MRPFRPAALPAAAVTALGAGALVLGLAGQAAAAPGVPATPEPSVAVPAAFEADDLLTPHALFARSQVASDAAAPDAAPATPPPAAPAAVPLAVLGRGAIAAGTTSERVTALQLRLGWVGIPGVPATGTLDAATARALSRFQAKHGLPVSGAADAATVATLTAVSRRGPVLDHRCTAVAVAICVDKTQKVLRFVQAGRTVLTLDANFGPERGEQDFGRYSRTREGAFTVYRKSADHVSTGYGTPMRWSLFFDGAEAMHFSDYFRRGGYAIRSFGCVDIGNESGARWVFQHAPVGTPFIVSR